MTDLPNPKAAPARLDAAAKVAGRERYAADHYGPDMLWAGARRAGLPHARLLEVDTRAVLSLPGVMAVLTAADVKGTNRQGVVRRDQPVLVDDVIRHAGDAVALVVARDEATLGRAIEAVRLRTEPLDPVLDPATALEDDAPRLHPDHPGGNELFRATLEVGRGAAAFDDCAVTAEAEFTTPHQEHVCLETPAGWAVYEDGRLTMTVSTQTPFRDRAEVAGALGLDAQDIRVVSPYLGGGFGAKDGVTVQSLLGLAALACPGRPVKMWWSREETHLAGPKRHPVRNRARLGVGRDGTFRAFQADLLYDTGAYDHLGGVVMTLGLEHAAGPYRVPNVSLRGRAVYTNNPVAGAFRGFGVPQALAAVEQLVDMAADRLGLDPLEIRRRNCLLPGDRNAVDVEMTHSVALKECLDLVAVHPLWVERQAWKAGPGPHRLRGVGLACVMQAMGYGPIIPDTAAAKLELTELGRLRVYVGVSDMGQGNASTFAHLAAGRLAQDPAGVELVLPDTAQTLNSGSSSASRTTYTFGNALLLAADRLAERMLEAAAGRLGVPASELRIEADRVVQAGSGRRIGLAELAAAMPETSRLVEERFTAPVSPARPSPDQMTQVQGLPHAIFSYAAHLARVEVDTLTGRLEVADYLVAADCGRIIQPQLFEQQIQGGVIQGLGFAVMEDFRVRDGRVLTPDLSTYLIPTSLDAPRVSVLAAASHEATGPLGLKGCGEVGLSGVLPAVSNALADAVGARVLDAPLTPERVLAALATAGRD